jgi:uncharacterized alpha-E superfamily protein
MLFTEYTAVLSGCLELLSALAGMERENITRGPGWLFLSVGRRLERAVYAVAQLREITVGLDADSWPLLEYLLEVADSSMTYRSRYFTTLQPVALLDVLMADGTNPRSLEFQLSHLVDLYQKLPRHMPEDLSAMRHALELLRSPDLRTLDYPLPVADQPLKHSEDQLELDRVLGFIQELLPSWADNVSNTYFGHARTLPIGVGG